MDRKGYWSDKNGLRCAGAIKALQYAGHSDQIKECQIEGKDP